MWCRAPRPPFPARRPDGQVLLRHGLRQTLQERRLKVQKQVCP